MSPADDGSDHLPSDVVHALMYILWEDPTAQSLVDEWGNQQVSPIKSQVDHEIFSSLLDREPVEPRLWKTITCPVLILHGEKDVPYPPEVAHDHYAALPNAARASYNPGCTSLLIVDASSHCQ
ncbi:hypothetical protein RhiXN_02238 [Rhizoctonia solani]|uniref:Uncharacterized protein n=1 Tax=Rhizoctonia solani TaxID=456999 RepID=A0A8H8T4Q3_9AGAM|nr:uncharacterized protein RhiXN_02238 [Rhizoctonia solani]QRW27643.1 hypothetical protein RhiXN_02238 [Rhizoctonia solani]